jgi:putative transposase
MPWEPTTVTDQKVRFIREYHKRVVSNELSMTALCAAHGISRKTGYKLVSAYETDGWAGLSGRSRAPHSGQHWIDGEIVSAVLDTRIEIPAWGAKKVLAYLRDQEPERDWPAVSVAHEWMRRAGLVTVPTSTRRFPHPGKPPAVRIERPNQQWSTDFKGHFRTRDRRYCYPLTVADSYSRMILGCDALRAISEEGVWPVFVRLFREYGLPETILSDNGTPFSSNSVRRLSKLSVRWIRLGITPRLIEPGKPQQNGSHERMHRTLKAAVCKTPAANCDQQQRPFDDFVERFNTIRPHEALGLTPPTRHYESSPRPYPKRLPEITYPDGFAVRRVRSSGEIKWDGQWLFVSHVLIGELIGFELVDDGCWIVWFSKLDLGYYSARDKKLYLDRPRPRSEVQND